jgi:hypothetical protein
VKLFKPFLNRITTKKKLVLGVFISFANQILRNALHSTIASAACGAVPALHGAMK